MKQLLLFILLNISLISLAQDASTPERYFPYPVPPESLESLSDRTSYLVHHFWDQCNLKSAIQRRDKFKGAFIDYVSFMPYAEATVVHESVESLINKFKNSPEQLLTLAEIAEECLYNDDAEFISDEVFLPFAQAVANNKKLKPAQKARFAYEASVLSQSQVGSKVFDLQFTRPDGTRSRLSEIGQGYVLIFFNDPECEDCAIARVRLSADHNVNKLIDDGRLKIVCIYPGEATDEWRQAVANYNDKWIVGAAADADDHFDMRNPPVFYYLNPSHTIMSKTLQIDNLLEAFHQVNSRLNR